jgi:integrase
MVACSARPRITEWLVLKKPQIENNTHVYHEINVRRHIKPHLGRVPLKKLHPPHVAALYSALEQKGVSAATRKHVGITLSSALNDAETMGLISNNPAKKVKKPKVDRAEIHPLDPEQLRVFLAATENDRLHALYVLAVDSGMRQGELFGLLWSEIAWDDATVTVVRSLEERYGIHRLKDVKTKSSRRRIRLTPATMATLNQHRRRQLAKGHYREDGPVFCDTDGGWLRKNNFLTRSFWRLTKRAGLADVRFHDLRHTCATLLLLRGVNFKVVSRRLGHSTIKTTLDVYSHVLPEMEEQATSTMQSLLAAGQTP